MAFVQAGQNGFTGAATVDVTLTGVANGNILVAFAFIENNSGTITLSTNAGSTGAWTQPAAINGDMSNFIQAGCGYAAATATGDVTIRASESGTENMLLHVVEFSDCSYDTSSMGTDDAEPFTLAALTPAYSGTDDAMLVACCIDWSGTQAQPTSTTGWTDTGVAAGSVYESNTQYRLYTTGDASCSFDAGADDGRHKLVQVVLAQTAAASSSIPIIMHHRRMMGQ